MNHNTFHQAVELDTVNIDGVELVRDPDGNWRYANNWIRVPGARDKTLTERFDPRLIIRSDGEIERVVVSGRDIQDGGDLLDWCLEVGSLVLEGDLLVEVLVPYSEWQARDQIPSEPFVPELHGTEAEKEVAFAERRFREAEQEMETAADIRAEALRRQADKMTRQEARAITGLSVGRIQQLIRADRLEDHEVTILRLFEKGPIKTFRKFQKAVEKTGLPSDEDLLNDLIRDLEDRGFLHPHSRDQGVGLTEEGAQFLDSARLERIGANP